MTKLINYRKELDILDKKLIEILSERFEIVKKVWEYKKENNMQILQVGRWEEVLNSRKKIGKEMWIKEEFIENIFNEIHDYSIELEK